MKLIPFKRIVTISSKKSIQKGNNNERISNNSGGDGVLPTKLYYVREESKERFKKVQFSKNFIGIKFKVSPN